MNTKIKVLKAGYFAGAYQEAGSEIELTERQLACVKRREREFEILDGSEPKAPAEGASGEPAKDEPAEDTQPAEGASGEPAKDEPAEDTQPAEGASGEPAKDEPAKVSVKVLKATLDDAGVEYPANAKKAELQALVDNITNAESLL